MNIFKAYKGLSKEIWVICFGKIATGIGSMVYPMLTMIMNQKLNMSASNIATFLLVFSMLNIPVILLSGRLCDYFSKKSIIIISNLIFIGLYLPCIFFETSFLTAVLIATGSLFQKAQRSAYDVLISENTLPDNRDRAYSLAYMGGNFGAIIAPMVGGILFKNYLWLMFVLNIIAVAIASVMTFFGIDEDHKIDSSRFNKYESSIASDESSLHFIASNRVIVVYLIFFCLLETVYVQFSSLIPLDLSRIYGEDGALIYGSFSSVNGFTVVVMTSILTAVLLNKKEITKYLYSIFFVLSGYTLLLISGFKLPLGYLAVFTLTIGEVLITLADRPFLSKRIPSSHRGRIYSIILVCSTLTPSLFQMLISRLWDNHYLLAWGFIYLLGILSVLSLKLLSIFDKKDYASLSK